MSDSPSQPFRPEDFRGQVRLFPLPQVSLFPHAVALFRVFEPRYCQLLHDALAGDELIAMAVLAPGWESDYEGRPPVLPVACLSRIVHTAKLADDTFHVMLQGVGRVRLQDELPVGRLYRVAAAELIPDLGLPNDATISGFHQQFELLSRRLLEGMGAKSKLAEPFEAFLAQQPSLSAWVDVLAHFLPLSARVKWKLLSEPNLSTRAEQVLAELRGLAGGSAGTTSLGGGKFPPEFSQN